MSNAIMLQATALNRTQNCNILHEYLIQNTTIGAICNCTCILVLLTLTSILGLSQLNSPTLFSSGADWLTEHWGGSHYWLHPASRRTKAEERYATKLRPLSWLHPHDADITLLSQVRLWLYNVPREKTQLGGSNQDLLQLRGVSDIIP